MKRFWKSFWWVILLSVMIIIVGGLFFPSISIFYDWAGWEYSLWVLAIPLGITTIGLFIKWIKYIWTYDKTSMGKKEK